MKEANWTLAMTLAWAIWREPHKVREFWNEWRLRKYVWEPARDVNGRLIAGFLLVRLTRIDLHDVSRADPAVHREIDQCTPKFDVQLWDKLQQGELVATGIPVGRQSRDRIQIPPYEWIDLSRVHSQPGNEDGVCDELGMLRFEKVRVARHNVLAIWPAGNIGQSDDAIAMSIKGAQQTKRRGPLNEASMRTLVKILEDFYAKNPGATRDMAKTAMAENLKGVRREDERTLFHKVPPQGTSGRKPGR
jgi:hypothetical protein